VKVKAAHRYTQGLDAVYAAFCDPAFYEAKLTGVGARNVRIRSQDTKAGRFRIETEREMRVDVPAVLRSVIGEWNSILQIEEWKGRDGAYHNDLELKSPVVPVTIRGTMDLRADGRGCVNEVEMDIRCDIPFVGRKLAELVAGSTERGLAEEYGFIRDYLGTAGGKAATRAAGGKSQKKRR